MSKKEFQDFVGGFFFQKQNSRYRKLKIIEREPFKRAELVIYINNLFFCFIFITFRALWINCKVCHTI